MTHLQQLFIYNDSVLLPHVKTAAFYTAADSIVIQRRLNVSLGGPHSLLHTSEEYTNHVLAYCTLQQSQP